MFNPSIGTPEAHALYVTAVVYDLVELLTVRCCFTHYVKREIQRSSAVQ